MSTFDQSFSNIHFSSQCLFFERVVPRKFHKIHKKIYMPALFFNKVAGGKKTPEQVHSCACCIILKNNCLLEHVKTAASDILGYPYLGGRGGGGCLLQSPYWVNAQFSPAFWQLLISNWLSLAQPQGCNYNRTKHLWWSANS